MDDLPRVSSSEVSKRFGYYHDKALTQILAIEHDGVARVVMLPAAEYERLSKLDHVALLPRELDRADLAALRDVAVPTSARDLDHLLD